MHAHTLVLLVVVLAVVLIVAVVVVVVLIVLVVFVQWLSVITRAHTEHQMAMTSIECAKILKCLPFNLLTIKNDSEPEWRGCLEWLLSDT